MNMVDNNMKMPLEYTQAKYKNIFADNAGL